MLVFYLRVRFKKTVLFLVLLIAALDMYFGNAGYYTAGNWKFYIEPKGGAPTLFSPNCPTTKTQTGISLLLKP